MKELVTTIREHGEEFRVMVRSSRKLLMVMGLWREYEGDDIIRMIYGEIEDLRQILKRDS